MGGAARLQEVVMHYLVRARAKPDKLDELAARLAADAFVRLEPFGRALMKGLRGARVEGDGAVWEEEDYCAPPLAQERAAVLDAYFDDITVEPVAKGEGWRRIAALPHLFANLQRARWASGSRTRRSRGGCGRRASGDRAAARLRRRPRGLGSG
jgi:hypothetical protein